MGMWGIKVGDSDQALDVFDMACRDEIYLKALINRNDMAYYLYIEETLCAIAIVDVSVNGIIDKKIWSNYVTNDKERMQLLKNVSNNWSPKWECVRDALDRLVMITQIDKDEDRKEIYDILEKRLGAAVKFISNEMCKRRKE